MIFMNRMGSLKSNITIIIHIAYVLTDKEKVDTWWFSMNLPLFYYCIRVVSIVCV